MKIHPLPVIAAAGVVFVILHFAKKKPAHGVTGNPATHGVFPGSGPGVFYRPGDRKGAIN